ncbi:MAG TPA: hypothetical protein VGO92_06130 [Acidimicrobiales bacterium]|jgi:hypothetical protein|nr:hypothetical protein [Acidimicrobiales bacterium]
MAGTENGIVSDADLEVDPADAQEQAEPVVDTEDEVVPDPPDIGLEVPEADAIEQSQPAPLVEDY